MVFWCLSRLGQFTGAKTGGRGVGFGVRSVG
jgi:hypothetical protein